MLLCQSKTFIDFIKNLTFLTLKNYGIPVNFRPGTPIFTKKLPKKLFIS